MRDPLPVRMPLLRDSLSISPNFGIEKITYVMAMLITILFGLQWHLWRQLLVEEKGDNYTVLVKVILIAAGGKAD